MEIIYNNIYSITHPIVCNCILYLIFFGYCYRLFSCMPKNWNIWQDDTFSCDILDLHAIPMLKYRTRKKIDWAIVPPDVPMFWHT